ncbi:MAG TPA: hypothetical protein VI451_20070 [Anaerolineales bacterium]|nr:hypothetical protein [Anaerolineales bacterium]
MKTPRNPSLLFAGEILAGALTGFDDLIGVLSAELIGYPLGVAVGN